MVSKFCNCRKTLHISNGFEQIEWVAQVKGSPMAIELTYSSENGCQILVNRVFLWSALDGRDLVFGRGLDR